MHARTPWLRAGAIVLALIGWAGCEGPYNRPNLPVPERFKARDLESGEVIDATSLKGVPRVVTVWAPKCHGCGDEIPTVEALREKWEKRGVEFIALSLERDPDKVLEGAREYGVAMPLAVAQGEVLAPLTVRSIPSVVFIDEDGVIRFSTQGGQKPAFFERRLEELVSPRD